MGVGPKRPSFHDMKILSPGTQSLYAHDARYAQPLATRHSLFIANLLLTYIYNCNPHTYICTYIAGRRGQHTSNSFGHPSLLFTCQPTGLRQVNKSIQQPLQQPPKMEPSPTLTDLQHTGSCIVSTERKRVCLLLFRSTDI